MKCKYIKLLQFSYHRATGQLIIVKKLNNVNKMPKKTKRKNSRLKIVIVSIKIANFAKISPQGQYLSKSNLNYVRRYKRKNR